MSYSHEINIDGKLDDPSWESAKEYTKFYESFPFTLKSPTSFQKVLILEDSDGIYFGFISQQKKEQIRANKHERDDEMSNADKVGVSIDFDGNGLHDYCEKATISANHTGSWFATAGEYHTENPPDESREVFYLEIAHEGGEGCGSHHTPEQASHDGVQLVKIGRACKDCMNGTTTITCLLYTSPSPRDATLSRMPSSA